METFPHLATGQKICVIKILPMRADSEFGENFHIYIYFLLTNHITGNEK